MSQRKQYKTARGQKFDFDAFLQDKTNSVSVGNLGGNRVVNAKGDILGKGGHSVTHKRSETVRNFYKDELPIVKENISIKEEIIPAKKPVAPLVHQEPLNLDDALTPEEAIDQLEKAKEEATKEIIKHKRTRKSK